MDPYENHIDAEMKKAAQGLPRKDIAQQALGILADELDASCFSEIADDLRSGLELGGLPGAALRAIEAALRMRTPDAGGRDAASVPQKFLELAEEVLERDGGKACGCIFHSRTAEREYDAGKCPHQRMAEMLAGFAAKGA